MGGRSATGLKHVHVGTGNVMSQGLRFEVTARDGAARLGRLETTHGHVDTPAFMPVGTQGAVKAVLPRDVQETGAQVILANTYHLSLDDRTELVERAGGLHAFMGWSDTILTDSGGFQVFSLPGREVTDEGVFFTRGKGNPRVLLDAEGSMDIQRRLGADIVMAFDECCAWDADRSYVKQSVERTARWAKKSREQSLAEYQSLFGIIQGGMEKDLRERSVAQITEVGFDGYAIGGVSVGEGQDRMLEVTGWVAPHLPEECPRYLMGVGLPSDIVEAIALGVDMFDCVIPTRYARKGTLFTRGGRIRINDRRFRYDDSKVDAACRCYCCRTVSRMTLRHLLYAREPVYESLASIHNLQYYQDLTREARKAIRDGKYATFREKWAVGSESPGS